MEAKRNGTRLAILVAAGVWALGGELVTAQETQAVKAMVGTALAEFETPNGPVVQLESRLRCSEAEREGRGYCPEPYAETLLADHASEVGATLVSEPTALPPCRWNEGETGQAKGLRMSLLMHRDLEGLVWISVSVSCERDSGHYMGSLFFQEARFPFRLVDGVWKRSGEPITIIT